MGLPMAKNLHQSGFNLTVFNRSANRTIELAVEGVAIAQDPREVAESSDIIFTMLADDAALTSVLKGNRGLLSAEIAGRLLVDMSTISVSGSANIAAAAFEREMGYVRAPVSGSTEFARTARLTILASGSSGDIDRCRPQLDALGNRVIVVGTAEEARVLKLAINLLIGSTAATLAETLVLAELGGIDWNTTIDVIGSSAVASPFVTYKLSKLRARNFRPEFRANQIAKDFGLALACAGDRASALRIANTTMSYWRDMSVAGLGETDLVGCLSLVESLVGLPHAEAKYDSQS